MSDAERLQEAEQTIGHMAAAIENHTAVNITHYRDLVKALRAGADPMAVADAIEKHADLAALMLMEIRAVTS